jgi:hypothetical protein
MKRPKKIWSGVAHCPYLRAPLKRSVRETDRPAEEVPGEHHGSTMAKHRFTLGELSKAVAKAAQMVNSRPVARDSGDRRTITPLHVLLG